MTWLLVSRSETDSSNAQYPLFKMTIMTLTADLMWTRTPFQQSE
jgi:hypothetical protein